MGMRSALRGRWGRVTFYRDARDMRDEQDFVVAIIPLQIFGYRQNQDFRDYGIFRIGLAQ